MRFKILKSLLIIFLLIIAFLVALSLLIKTDTVQQKLVGLVEASVKRKLGQEFSIGSVDFDVIRGVVIHDVQLNIDGEDFVKLETLEIGYPIELSNIMKQLSQRQIRVNKIIIKGLYLSLRKQNDGRWNYSALKKQKSEEKKSSKTKKSGAGWRIRIPDAGIYESKIRLKTDVNKPEQKIDIKKFETSMDFNTNGNFDINVREGDVSIMPDNITIEKLVADMKRGGEELNIEKVNFNLNGSPVTLSAGITGKDKKEFNFQSSIRGFKFESGLINFQLEGTGEFNNPENIDGRFSLKIENSEYHGNMFSFNSNDIRIKNSKLEVNNAKLTGDLGNVTLNASTDIKKLSDKNLNNEFKVSILAKDIKYSELTSFSKLQDTNVNALKDILLNTEINAQGYFNSKNNFNIYTNLTNLSLAGAAGNAVFSGDAGLSNKNIKLKLSGETKDLNLMYFTRDQNYNSSLNSRINIDTDLPFDFDIKKTIGTIDIDILGSAISNRKIYNGEIYSEFKNENIYNARVNINSDFLNIKMSGGSIDNNLDFDYQVESKDLNFISKLKPGLNITGNLTADGTVRGDISNPIINYSVNTSQNEFKSIGVAGITSDGTINFKDNFVALDSKGEILDLDLSGNKFSKIEYVIRSQDKDLICSVNAIKDENNTIDAEFRVPDFKKNKQIEFTKILLRLDDLIYQNQSPFYVNFRDGLKVDGFNLTDGNSSIDMNLSKKTNEINTEITIRQFDIETIFNLASSEESPAGILSGTINASGSPQNIKFQTNLQVDKFRYREFESDIIRISSSYKRPGLSLDIKSKQGGQYTLDLFGNVQTDLDLNNFGNSIKDSQMNLTLKSTNLDLSPVTKFVGAVKEIHGYLGSSLQIQGKINSPLLYGDISLNNIELRLKSLNNKLTLQEGNIVFQGSEAWLNDIVVSSGDGKGVINGSFDLRNLNYDLKANLDHLTMKPKTVRTNVTGDLSLTGKDKRMRISGKVKLNKTRISLKESKSEKASEIKFVNGDQDQSEEIIIKDKKKEDYFRDNISMDVSVKIPKNSWVRGKGANVELKGNIDIDKDYEDEMVLTGNISTVRGTYKIFGKLFKIQEGNVNFPAIKKINPLLDITALYNVADVNVFVDIGGDVESPKITLRSDPSLEETDIISYLLFGAPSDKLGTGERSSLRQAAAGIAGGAVLNEFKGVLGDEFSPDVLSFGSGAAGPELEVGKYLNDDLYVAYERKTSSDASTPIPTDNVKVEYRLFDFLSVASEVGSEQAGGDFFFNFDF